MNKRKENFLIVFEINTGNVSETCKKVGISRNTFYDWCKKDKEFNTKIKEIKESLLDFAESVLMKKIKNGDITALIFFLKTKGKHRGYSERFEVENKEVEEFSSEKAIRIYLPKKRIETLQK